MTRVLGWLLTSHQHLESAAAALHLIKGAAAECEPPSTALGVWRKPRGPPARTANRVVPNRFFLKAPLQRIGAGRGTSAVPRLLLLSSEILPPCSAAVTEQQRRKQNEPRYDVAVNSVLAYLLLQVSEVRRHHQGDSGDTVVFAAAKAAAPGETKFVLDVAQTPAGLVAPEQRQPS
jgi:hypothetical protein